MDFDKFFLEWWVWDKDQILVAIRIAIYIQIMIWK